MNSLLLSTLTMPTLLLIFVAPGSCFALQPSSNSVTLAIIFQLVVEIGLVDGVHFKNRR